MILDLYRMASVNLSSSQSVQFWRLKQPSVLGRAYLDLRFAVCSWGALALASCKDDFYEGFVGNDHALRLVVHANLKASSLTNLVK